MERSEQIGDLAGALAKAQGEMKSAAKDTQNTFYKSSYADLAAVMEACREPLSKNALAVVQTVDYAGDEIWLETTLAHSSGQWMRSKYPIRPVKNDPQGVGSAQTYARRYSLMAMVGIVASDDDDGNAASGKSTNGNGHTDPLPPLQRPKAGNGNGDPGLAAAKWAQDAEQTIRHFVKHTDLRVWEKDNQKAIEKLMGVDRELGRHLVGLIADRFAALNPMNAG